MKVPLLLAAMLALTASAATPGMWNVCLGNDSTGEPRASQRSAASQSSTPVLPSTGETPVLRAGDTQPATQPATQPTAAPTTRRIGSTLDFRIAALTPSSENLPEAKDARISKDEMDESLASLSKHEPDALLNQNAKLIWLPVRAGDDKQTLSDRLITASHGGKTYLLVWNSPDYVMTHDQGWTLKQVFQGQDQSAQPNVGMTLDNRGAKLMLSLTKANVGNALAIIVDGTVYSAPRIMSPISSECMISGKFTKKEVAELIASLKAGMSQPHVKPPATAPAVDPAALKILNELERAGGKYTTVQADVVFESVDAMLGDKETRTGWIAWQSPTKEQPVHLLRITFETLRQGDGRKIKAKVDHTFDGQWFTIAKHRIRQMTRYQVAAEGEWIDPMRLGKGPFPLPFGQKTADMLEHFEVTTRPALKTDSKNTDYLMLTTRRRHYEEMEARTIEMWVDRTTHLPVRMITMDRNKTTKTADFTNIRTNEKIDRNIFHIPSRGWQLRVEPLQRVKNQVRRDYRPAAPGIL